MLKTFSRVGAAVAALVLLAGCIDRAEADAKLAKACGAGVASLLPEGSRIDAVKSHTASDSPEGFGYRHVTIKTMFYDGWLEEDRDYDCIFEESFGFMNAHFTASIHQIRLPERVVGKSGGEILGDAEDFIKLTDAVRKALYEE